MDATPPRKLETVHVVPPLVELNFLTVRDALRARECAFSGEPLKPQHLAALDRVLADALSRAIEQMEEQHREVQPTSSSGPR